MWFSLLQTPASAAGRSRLSRWLALASACFSLAARRRKSFAGPYGFGALAGLLYNEAAPKQRKLFFSGGQVSREGLGHCFRELRGLCSWIVLSLAWCGVVCADEPLYDIDVPAMNAADALNRFAEQTGAILLFPYELARTRQANSVRGRYTLLEGLQHLLEGTGLSGGLSDKRVVSISQIESARRSREEGAMLEQKTSLGTRIAAVLASMLSAGAARGQNTDDGMQPLEEILVTAQKREERLAEVPISISVLGGESLDESSYSSVNEVLRTVPGIASFEFAQGAGMSKFSVRGVTSNDSIFNGSATVGYYLDEIPFAFVRFPVSPDVNAFDLERVEVLRGPQGTLYGANALNGVIRVMTRDADLSEPEFSARTTYSSTKDGGDNYRGDAALSVPLIPKKLAVRAVAGYADYGGWIDQPFTGRRDVNDMEQKNLRLKVNAAPTEGLGIELLSWFSRDDRGSPSTSRDDRTTPATFPEAVESQIDAFGMTLTYQLPGVSILSSTSYLDYSGSNLTDFPPGVDMTVTALTGRLLSEEIRVNSSSEGPWKWSVGGIYREEEDSSRQDLLRNAIASLSGVSENVYTSDSFALYGEISRLFGDEWELTAGLRYFEDESTSDERSVFNPVDTPFGKSTDKFDAVTPRVVLSYRPTDTMNYYASYSQGFRSGFAQNGQVLRLSGGLSRNVDPDRLTNYEIGTKGSAFAGRFNYELAAYYISWKDAVQVLLVRIPNINASWNGAINSEGVNGFGADVAFGVQVNDGVELGATFSWNELGFTDPVISGSTLIYAEGDRPASSPEMNASAYLTYERPVAAGYSLQFGGSASYTTKMAGSYLNNVRLYGEDFMAVRANVTVKAPAGWSAMLFVDNVTDEGGKIRAESASTLGSSDRMRPRTFGLQLDYRY